MRKFLLATAALLALASSAQAEMSKDEIDKLPQDKVQVVRRHCAEMFPTDFGTRLYCEDQEFKALKALIDRGSIARDGR